ncbi:MAG TPA: SIS domain-containing protein [Polyangiaceae bacterium]|nr:SIS domain-containing protein [Polyangiaceae bacterium]
MSSKSQFFTEILEQPATLRRLLSEGREPVQKAAAKLKEFGPEWALIAARGSSDNAARYAQYLLGAHNGLGVALAVPSLISLYGATPRMGRAAVIGISQSGQSPDIVGVLSSAAKQGAVTIAVTNDPASPLAKASNATLPLLAGEEKGIAATKTYTAQLLSLAMLSVALEGSAERQATLAQVPGYVEQVIESVQANVSEAAQGFAKAGKLVVLGRGFNYATTFEVALKIKETSYCVAEPYSIADLLHGPVAMIDQEFPVIVIAASGAALTDIPTLFDLLEKRGARTLAISDRPDVLSRAHFGLKLPSGVPEWLSPIVAVVAGQLFANALCLASGQDPDKPRGLSKVTLTR